MQFEQLGPYRLGKKLGQGGMGTVYAGIDSESGEAAAIKVLASGLAAEEGFRARFEAEIESLKKLRHPNIVRLYGYGEQSGTLFYAMEQVNGTSLEEELRAGRRFDWREVTQIAIKLCRALKHAHDHGVIHRDLKPANLLMTSDGEIKLSDFGIARLFGNTRMTSDGGVLGTAEYMAPEQAEGRAVTDRCDQYSLGGVLYALLAGRPPFRAKSFVEMLQLQRFAAPEPVTRFAPQTPAELARIIHQLLEKEPQKRFANTLMLSRSLEAMERGLSISLSRGDDFVLAPPELPAAGNSGYSPRAPTLSPEQLADMNRPPATGASHVNATEGTMAFTSEPQRSVALAREPEATGDASASRFTKVEEHRDQRTHRLREALSALLAPQTVALAAGVLLLMMGGWYLMQPPTADELYRQILAATADGDVESLEAAKPRIDAFLARYPDDGRGEKLRGMQDELKQAHPVQRLYTEAKRYTFINPEMASAKFQALIDVYDDDQAAETTRHWVKLAKLQRKQLQKRINQYVVDGQRLLEARLAKAAELAPDNPAAARKIYQGVVELYDEKPWAAELVRQAKTALVASQDPQAAAQ
jgi:serine/threonine-protein kinase